MALSSLKDVDATTAAELMDARSRMNHEGVGGVGGEGKDVQGDQRSSRRGAKSNSATVSKETITKKSKAKSLAKPSSKESGVEIAAERPAAPSRAGQKKETTLASEIPNPTLADALSPVPANSDYEHDSSEILDSLELPHETNADEESLVNRSVSAGNQSGYQDQTPLSDIVDEGEFSDSELWQNDVEIAEIEDKDLTFDLERIGQAQDLRLEQDLESSDIPTEIHILGVGTVGKFIAHGLAGLPNPPKITLLMQRPLLMQQWHDEGAALAILRDGRLHTRRGFNIESSAKFKRIAPGQRFPGFGPNLEHSAEPPTTIIDSLIVTTASKFTIPALMAVRDRLRPSSSICLIQDGLGIVESLNAMVFPDPQRRPTYILGHLSNASSLQPGERNFTIEQKGDVKISCSKLPQRYISSPVEKGPNILRTDHSWQLPAAFLVGSLARVPEFNTETIAHDYFTRAQMQRVIAHSVVGPMSVLYDCSNRQMISDQNVQLSMRLLLQELSSLVLALPELRGLPRVQRDFAPKKLESIVRSVMKKNMDKTTTMLENVRAGKRTDIDYSAGYFLIRAAELGVPCPRMEMLFHMVKGKQGIWSRTVDTYVPFSDG
jgi:2-dehydropantoate 2-reductase